MKKKYIIVVGMLLLALIGWWLFPSPSPAPEVAGDVATTVPTLSLSPHEESVVVGEFFDVRILLDTGGAVVAGIDAVLDYDPSLLSIDAQNVSVTAPEFPARPMPIINAETGTVSLSALVEFGQSFTGATELGMLRFRARAGRRTDFFCTYTRRNRRQQHRPV